MDALFQLAAAEGAACRGPPERVGKSLIDRTLASMSEIMRRPARNSIGLMCRREVNGASTILIQWQSQAHSSKKQARSCHVQRLLSFTRRGVQGAHLISRPFCPPPPMTCAKPLS